ncbi:hypothetical protein WA026_023514 [Henosepilachna vigintioctopunctata]|uniref:Gag-pol polyprotein n=1 Tax=Henosepilachna vigintioctopunctata TaxID=420089 RepID=A0AAW1U0I7_9CUCU
MKMKQVSRQCPQNTRGRSSGRLSYRVSRNRGYRGGFNSCNQQQQANKADEKQEEAKVHLYAANLCNVKDRLYYVMDSGASNHFVREEYEELMSNIQILTHEVTIQIANGENLKSNKIGKKCEITKALR